MTITKKLEIVDFFKEEEQQNAWQPNSCFPYRGVHLEFDVSNRKLTIYLAIMAMDLFMVNYKRVKDRSAFPSAKEMVDSNLVKERLYYYDLIGHSSAQRIAAFEGQNREKIDKYLPEIKFIFKNN